MSDIISTTTCRCWNITLKFVIVLLDIKLQPLTLLALAMLVVAVDRSAIKLAGNMLLLIITF